MKLVTFQQLEEEAVRNIVPEIDIVSVKTEEDLLREAVDAEIVVGVRPDFFPALLRQSPALRWAHTSTAGVDRYLCDELRSGPVTLTCAKGGAAGRNLAEHALGLALALSRNIGEAARSSTWRRGELSPGAFELSGKKVGIAGYGAAGVALSDLLTGFHVDILAVKRSGPYEDPEGVRVLPPSGFAEMLKGRDMVFNFLPGTAETERIFDRSAFAAMKAGSLFVNVGRGSTVDTDELVRALREGTIGGAGIDTVDPEPLPDDHPLWSMRNVVVSPHIAGVSPDRSVRNQRSFLENLRRYSKGEALNCVVDSEAGY